MDENEFRQEVTATAADLERLAARGQHHVRAVESGGALIWHWIGVPLATDWTL